MISFIVAVRDRAVDAFGQPFFVKHLGEAIRSFQDEVNRNESPFKAHPDDYDLYHLGEYDDATGGITSRSPVMLRVGKECVRD